MHPPSALSMGVRCGHIGLERQSLNSNIIRQNPASRLVLKYLDRTLGRSLLDIINQDKVNPKYLPGLSFAPSSPGSIQFINHIHFKAFGIHCLLCNGLCCLACNFKNKKTFVPTLPGPAPFLLFVCRMSCTGVKRKETSMPAKRPRALRNNHVYIYVTFTHYLLLPSAHRCMHLEAPSPKLFMQSCALVSIEQDCTKQIWKRRGPRAPEKLGRAGPPEWPGDTP
eukprot:1137762-Pelagomonas_calceolata.AAC.9